MKILFTASGPWNHQIPYYIAPQRILRACLRAGHEAYSIDIYGDPYSSIGLQPKLSNTVFDGPYGKYIHATSGKYMGAIKEALRTFRPDFVYVLGWRNYGEMVKPFKENNVPFGLHRADPFWYAVNGVVKYPTRGEIKQFCRADFFTCNEGQAWNYLYQHGMEGKVHLLSHAIDPFLAPSLDELKRTEKKYVCSTILGGEDPLRRIEFLKYYYQWTDHFPDHTFISGGGLWKSMKYIINEVGEKVKYPNSLWYSKGELRAPDLTHATEEEVESLSHRSFNVTKVFDYNCETFPNKIEPSVLCHRFIHKLYSESYYGFTPYGWYIIDGPQSEYQIGPLGTKTTEMGGSGAAMIANRIRGVEELIIDGKTGFIMDKPEDTKDIFQYAIDNPDEVRKMGEAAYKDIHKRHSWDIRYREVLVPLFKDLGLM